MTILVPFDGSDLAEAALIRATQFGNLFDEDVLAVSVIPKEIQTTPENAAGLNRTKSSLWNLSFQRYINR
mgnify:CR=1 FL=1